MAVSYTHLDVYKRQGLAAAKINSFIWDVYCDWCIEIAKPRLNSGDAEQAEIILVDDGSVKDDTPAICDE